MLKEFIAELTAAQEALKENEQMKVEVKALEERRDELLKEVKELESDLKSSQKEATDFEYQYNESQKQIEDTPAFTEYGVGLDTLFIGSLNGNILIAQKIEQFVANLQSQFSTNKV